MHYSYTSIFFCDQKLSKLLYPPLDYKSYKKSQGRLTRLPHEIVVEVPTCKARIVMLLAWTFTLIESIVNLCSLAAVVIHFYVAYFHKLYSVCSHAKTPFNIKQLLMIRIVATEIAIENLKTFPHLVYITFQLYQSYSHFDF